MLLQFIGDCLKKNPQRYTTVPGNALPMTFNILSPCYVLVSIAKYLDSAATTLITTAAHLTSPPRFPIRCHQLSISGRIVDANSFPAAGWLPICSRPVRSGYLVNILLNSRHSTTASSSPRSIRPPSMLTMIHWDKHDIDCCMRKHWPKIYRSKDVSTSEHPVLALFRPQIPCLPLVEPTDRPHKNSENKN